MTGNSFSRRGLMQGAAALGAAALIPQGLSAQQVVRTASTPGAPLPGRGELLIRGATVLTMDPAVPDLAAGDVHVREGTIIAVAPMIEAPAAQVVDGAGMICIPGFVDTHFHLWNALFRLFVRADVPALGYFPVTARLGPLMEPEDSYRSVRLGAAEALAAGVTTVHNWSHNTRSPEHADAELSGMRDMGIRGRFAYGTPVGLADDAPMDFAGLARVKKDWIPDKDNLLTLGICSRNLGALTIGGSAAAASRGVLDDRADQARLGWRPRPRPADHHAHVRLQPDHGAGASRAARSRRPARPSAADHKRRAGDPQGPRRQLLDLAPARGAPVIAAWRHPARRTAGGRRQGQFVDGPRRIRQLRSVQRDAHFVRAARASYRRESAAHVEAAFAAGDDRRRRRSRHRRPHGFDHARQTRRPGPGTHHGHRTWRLQAIPTRRLSR